MIRRVHVAAAVVVGLLLSGCSGSGGDASGAAMPDKDAAASVDQSTPGRAAQSYFEAVADARFGDACSVLAPVARDTYVAAGQDCQTEMRSLFDEETRLAGPCGRLRSGGRSKPSTRARGRSRRRGRGSPKGSGEAPGRGPRRRRHR